jgi:hypothetical protein
MAFDTARLISQVNIKATLPQGRYTDSEILDTSYDVLLSQMVPLILNLKEEYYVSKASQTVVANAASYSLPASSFGLSLREVKLISSNNVIDLARIDPGDVDSTATGSPVSFYLEGQNVVLYPTPQFGGDTLELSYFKTPSKPVLTTETATITAIDTGTGVVSCVPPSAWTTANSFQFTSRENGHKVLGSSLTASALTTSSITFAPADLPTTLAVGDSVSLNGESSYFEIPDSCFPLMIQMVSNEFLEALGDPGPLNIGLAKAEQLKQNVISFLGVRVLGAPKRSTISL